ncbi:hypothetical protein OKA05_04555 [Luteolibacter arcticus]|uniref:Uncharacterized protein n=1 Tax=Luteolibacter arcticus TaxID=1581411 RepID=A0ABT3GDW7_9BACT|nr:hypothetical protein [Luteolibacter arcticus]MCW1921811.1 hypothetical protein [Luteolibacter arcticus]
MKLAQIIGVASVAVISSAYAGEPAPNAFYKVKITAQATIQTALDETSSAQIDTNDVIEALLDELGTPTSSPQHFDIIATYEGEDDQVMEVATYYLARTRGPADERYKVLIPTGFFDTEGGSAVFKRVFTANNSTLKVNITDSFSLLEINTSMLSLDSQGLAKAQVTVKDTGEGGDPFLSLVKNNFSGNHVVGIDDVGEGVGSINANIGGAIKKSVFDSLPDLTPIPVPI